MNCIYVLLTISQSFWISFKNSLLDWKMVAADSTVESKYLLPIPTLLYCLHNYNLMDRVSNFNATKNVRLFRNVLVYALCGALCISVMADAYYFDSFEIDPNSKNGIIYCDDLQIPISLFSSLEVSVV